MRCFTLSVIAAGVLTVLAPAPAFALLLHSADVAWERPVKNVFVWNRDGCTGKNQSPALRWDDVPAKTASFALTVFDPDAPTGHGWVHWVRSGIPATARTLGRADATTGIDGPNDYGAVGYGGPCPPKGANPHRYVFTLYALDAGAPALAATTTYAQLIQRTHGHVLAQAQLVTRYGRR